MKRIVPAGFCVVMLILAALMIVASVDVSPRVPDMPGNIDVSIQTDGSRASAGSALWVFNTTEAAPISTPVLGDLNGDGDMEIVFASSGDAVYGLNPEGTEHWSQAYTDKVIDPIDSSGLSFNPVPLFGSPILADVDMGSDPEVIVGVEDGILFLKNDGTLFSLKGQTSGNYFSTPALTDLEGEWTGLKDDLEIVIASDATDRNCYLEAYKAGAGQAFRESVTVGLSGGLVGGAVVTLDMDGSFENGRIPTSMEETDAEIQIGTFNDGLRIYERKGSDAGGNPNYDERTTGTSGGRYNWASAAAGNFSGNSSSEIIIGSADGFSSSWSSWSGKVQGYDQYGNLEWTFSTGTAPSGVFSSPAVCDVQMDGANPVYEIFFGCDNGKFYCISESTHTELWSYSTGARIISSPAILNIDQDGELEVVVGCDDGKVYCFDGDPSDGIDDGANVPGDGASHDLLWVYDAGAPIGISSPVVADINNDGELEVVIGDTSGAVHCISAGGSSAVGQVDWPKFRFDLNNTGVYKEQKFLPKIVTPDVTSTLEDQFYTVAYQAVNAKTADGYVWSMSTNASWLGFNPATAVLSGMPGNQDVGTYWVELEIKNSTLGDIRNFTLEVINVNDAPGIDTADIETAYEDSLYYNLYSGSDMDPTGDVLTWGMATNASFLLMTGNNLSGIPDNEDVGEYWVLVNLSDNQGGYAESNFTLTVVNTNDAPVILGSDLAVATEDEPYANDYNVVDMDAGDDVFTWSLDSSLGFLSIDQDGNLSGLPMNDDVGGGWVNVTVEDGYSGTASRNFTLTVYNVNDAPWWVNVPNSSYELGLTDTFSFAVQAMDMDAEDVLTYSVSSTELTSITINKNTGNISWVPDGIGTYDFNISASDGEFTIFHDFTIEVKRGNSPPTAALIYPANGSVLSSTEVNFEWTVADLDGDEVSSTVWWSDVKADIEGLASEAFHQVANGTGLKVSELERGTTYYWTVVPGDGSDTGVCSSGIWPFSISDSAVEDMPPVLSSSPDANAPVSMEWTYKPVAVDPEGKDVVFELVNGPIGMFLIEGELTFTPTEDQLGEHLVIMTASDGNNLVYHNFTIEVVPLLGPLDDDDDDDSGLSGVGLWIIFALIALVVLIAIIIAVVVILRRKKEVDEEYPAADDSDALEAEMESDEIFKQKEQGVTTAQQAQPIDQTDPYSDQYQDPTMMAQPGAAYGMPGAEEAMGMPGEDQPQMDTPVPEQLPAWGDGSGEVEVALPDDDYGPDIDDPYASDVETPAAMDDAVKQLPKAKDEFE